MVFFVIHKTEFCSSSVLLLRETSTSRITSLRLQRAWASRTCPHISSWTRNDWRCHRSRRK